MSAQGSQYTQHPTAYQQQPTNNTMSTQQNAQASQYNSQAPQQPNYQQAAYGQPNQMSYPQQTVEIDPITGAPVNGGVMGI